MKGKVCSLGLTTIDPLTVIREAIRDAEAENIKVLKIGIPLAIQKMIFRKEVGPDRKFGRLKQLFGIPVTTTGQFQITRSLSLFKPYDH